MSLRLLILLLVLPVLSEAADWSDYYLVEEISIPAEVDPQIGGVCVLKDGRVAACFFRGQVLIYDPATGEWSEFASGLQTPLGLVEEKSGSLVVMQWAELTRLSDTDGDDKADFYQSLFDDFGVSGNYHEFAFGPAMDADGNFYISLNVASNGAGVFEHVRGPFSPIGYAREEMTGKTREQWQQDKVKAGRMYSRVPYRGWVLKISPDGEATPFASGFRSPDGIGIDEKGRVWVTDNQGDWRGTSPLYHVEQDKFYGHPASLIWKPGWDRDPLDMSSEELEAMRTPASALFPQGELANSPTQPIATIAVEKFGLPRGELIIGEQNQPTLIRFLEDEVDGFAQGTFIPFLNDSKLGFGNHRFDFGEDGSLWVGRIHLGWAGGEGMARVKWNGKQPFLVEGVRLEESGFELKFNRAAGAAPPQVKVSSHRYLYHSAYGSPKTDEREEPVQSLTFSEGRRSLRLKLASIEERRLYTIELTGAVDGQEQPLMGDVLRYNVVKRR